MGKTKKIDINDFIGTVQSIADGYFNEQGTYEPHWGMLNSMQIYHDVFYVDKEEDKINGQLEIMQQKINDKKFIDSFNKEVKARVSYDLTFSCAYHQAMEVVEYKKSSFYSVIDYAQKVLSALYEQYEKLPQDKTFLDNITNAVASIKNGELGKAIVQEYTSTSEFKERTEAILNSKEDESSNKIDILS